MNRREFLAAVAVAGHLPIAAAERATSPGHAPTTNPYDSVFARIPAQNDVFACEKLADLIESALPDLLAKQALPPMLVRYRSVAANVEQAEFGEGGAPWADQLGEIRYANFYALPDDLVRYEIAASDGYRVGLWKQEWRQGKLVSCRPVEETRTRAAAPLFRDVTGDVLGPVASFREQLSKGNTWWRARLDAATGIDIYSSNGIAVGDVDGDGRDEIYVCQPGGLPNRLYKVGEDGRLVDITEASGLGVLDDTTCALFLDLTNSGHQDAVVLRGSGPLLFRNDGTGRFTHQPDAFRFANAAQGSFTGMAAADYDRDGRLDLYLCCYVYFQSEDQYRYPVPYHDARNGPPNFLFRNRLTAEGGQFEDVTDLAGLNQNNDRYSFAPAWCDVDGDGWPDLYVANDFGRNNLYRNRGGKFRDEAAAAGVEDLGPGMSAAWADYDGDGKPDLYVSNMWSAPGQRIVRDPEFGPSKELPEEYRRHTKGNSLYRNRGDGTFAETGAEQGVEMGRWAWMSDAVDFDNDGVPEIYVTAGMLSHPRSTADLRSFFWRQVVAKSPATAKPAPEYENGWNAINQAIREDSAWCGGDRNVFYVRGAAGHYHDFSGVSGLDFADDSRSFAAVDFDGDGNLDLVLKSRQGPQVRVLRNECGVGKRVAVIRLRGTQSNRDAIGAKVQVLGRTQWVSAGSGYLSQHTKDLHFPLKDAAEAEARVVWPSGLVESVRIRAGERCVVEEESGKALRSKLRARGAVGGSVVVAENMPGPSGAWLLEPVPLPDQRKGPGLVTIDVDREPAYAIFQRYLFEYRTPSKAPLRLLIDGENRAVRVLTGDGSDAGGKPRPLPFSGKYYQTPHRNYFKLGAAFYWAGYARQAVPYLDEVVRRNPANWKALNAIARIQLDGEEVGAALENYQKVLVLKPSYGPALTGAGEAYAQRGDAGSAERMFLRALEVDPNDSDAANQLGVLCGQQNRFDDAKRYFQRAIAAHRDHAGALNNLAVLYVKLGQTGDAVAAFQFGIEQSPGDKTLYMNLGRLYAQSGEMEKARQVMRRWLALNPGDASAAKAMQELDGR